MKYEIRFGLDNWLNDSDRHTFRLMANEHGDRLWLNAGPEMKSKTSKI